jgi:DNA-3-methyladenine glycosylase
VLVRGAEPDEGINLMKDQFQAPEKNLLTNGPGKLCKAFRLTREQNGLDLTGTTLYLEDRDYRVDRIMNSTRIGIKKGAEKKWRFFDSTSKYVSRNK